MSVFFSYLTGRAGSALGDDAKRVMPVTAGASLKTAALLAGWLLATGLVLTAAVWAISGEFLWTLTPLAAGVALGFVLARTGRRVVRGGENDGNADDISPM